MDIFITIENLKQRIIYNSFKTKKQIYDIRVEGTITGHRKRNYESLYDSQKKIIDIIEYFIDKIETYRMVKYC